MERLELFIPDPLPTGQRPGRVVLSVVRNSVNPQTSPAHPDGIGKTAAQIRRWEKAIDDAIAHRREPGGVVQIRSDGQPGEVPVPGRARTVSLRPVFDPEANQSRPVWRYDSHD